MPLLHRGWHVTSRTRQQTPDRSASEIQLSKRVGGGGGRESNPLSSRMSAGGCRSTATHTYTRKAIRNTDASTRALTQRHDSSSQHTVETWAEHAACTERVLNQVSAASSQLTSHQNLATRREKHENSQLNGISEGLCHRNGLNYVSCQSGFSRRLSKTQDWGLVAKLRLLRPFPLQQKLTGCFLFPRAQSCGQHVTQGGTFIINNTQEERGGRK